MKCLKTLFVCTLLFCQLAFAADPTTPQIDVPSENGVLENGSTLKWSANGADVDEWWVSIGSEPASATYLNSGSLAGAQQLIVDGLPSDGSAIHVRLWHRQSDESWSYTDSIFTAGTTPISVQIMSPVAGDVLSGPSDTFTWDANGMPVEQWWLYVGTTEGGQQIYNSGDLGAATSADVAGIVTDRSTVYVRLWYKFNQRQWRYIDTTYTAASLAAPTITAPEPGSSISGDSVTFSWDVNETTIDESWFFLGSTVGDRQYFDSESLGTATSVQVTGLPEDGSTVFARLWHRQSGSVWLSVDAEYISAEEEDDPEPPEPPEPPDVDNGKFCEGFVSNTDSFVVPSMAKPKYLQSYSDPTFNGRVTRITDSAFGEVNKPAYSTMQAWNADESLLMVYRTGNSSNKGHKLLDGHTYKFKQDLDIVPSDLEEVYWSRTDPDKFFYVSKRSSDYGKLNRFSVSANQATEIADFSSHCGSGLPSAGNDVQMHSLDDDLFGFTCRKDDGRYIMLSYRLSTDQIVSAPMGGGTEWSEWFAPIPSASGSSFWHQGVVIGTDLRTKNFKLDLSSYSEHGSLGLTSNGQDAYYHVSFGSSPNGCDGDADSGIGHLVEHNLETGGCRTVIGQAKGYTYPTSSTHVSALAYLKPNRVVVSSIGSRAQTSLLSNGAAAPPLFSEIYVAQTDLDNTVVCRFAHHRSFGKSATKGGYAAYFGEPHATISPSGTRVIFGSDWYDSGAVDSFVLELPDYVKP